MPTFLKCRMVPTELLLASERQIRQPAMDLLQVFQDLFQLCRQLVC